MVAILCVFADQVKANLTCSLSKYCTAAGWCENFTSLAELNSLLPPVWATTVCQDFFEDGISENNDYSGYSEINLKANEYKSLVNERLDMYRFLSSVFLSQFMAMNFCGFTGLDLNLTIQRYTSPFPADNLTQTPYNLRVGYIASSVDLYMNGTPIVMSTDGARTCDETQLAKILNNTNILFVGHMVCLIFLILNN
jgi:hypothetical protein